MFTLDKENVSQEKGDWEKPIREKTISRQISWKEWQLNQHRKAP